MSTRYGRHRSHVLRVTLSFLWQAQEREVDRDKVLFGMKLGVEIPGTNEAGGDEEPYSRVVRTGRRVIPIVRTRISVADSSTRHSHFILRRRSSPSAPWDSSLVCVHLYGQNLAPHDYFGQASSFSGSRMSRNFCSTTTSSIQYLSILTSWQVVWWASAWRRV